jgi:dolichol-phosphate mannosyltransferase
LLGAWYVVTKLLGWVYNPGLPTTVLVVTFFSGVQLLSLGLMGEYVGRIYDEVKRRPKYIVDRRHNMDEPTTGSIHLSTDRSPPSPRAEAL